MPRQHRSSILIFNFFGGILKRGIPLYVDNLCIALEAEGVSCKQLRCPNALRGLPRPLLNFVFVIAEQLVTPIAGLWFDKVIYPSNSVAVAGAFSGKTAVIFHDFVSSRRRNNSVAALYVKMTQAVYRKTRSDVVYISRSTQRIAHRFHKFVNSRSFIFPNSFFRSLQLISEDPPPRRDEVLLCSGWGKNKDLCGALQIYRESCLYKTRRLRILGLAGRNQTVELYCKDHPELATRITILPQIDDQAVVREYETAAWTWVHSLAEGYGRSIAEARLCGSRVVASNIAPFREQADEATFLYRGVEEFKSAVSRCEAYPACAPRRIPPEHDILHAEIRRFLGSKEL